MSTINAITSPVPAVITTTDNTGNLAFQTAGTTVLNLDANQNATFTGSVSAPNTFGFKNRIINGAMNIWQRGTSFTSLSGYCADRMIFTTSGTGTSITATRESDAPNAKFLYSLKYLQATSAATSVTEFALRYRFELSTMMDLAGSPVTVSFWYKSNRTGNHCCRLGMIGSSVVGASDSPIAFNYTTSGVWQYVTITFNAWTNITSWGSTALIDWAGFLDLGFSSNNIGTTGTINANDYFQITGLQLEKGNVATPFDVRPYSTELALCHRYYYSLFNGIGQTASAGYLGEAVTSITASALSMTIRVPVPMRSYPSFVYNNPSGTTLGANWAGPGSATFGTTISSTSTNFGPSYQNSGFLVNFSAGNNTMTGSGGSTYGGAAFLYVFASSTSSTLALSAEL